MTVFINYIMIAAYQSIFRQANLLVIIFLFISVGTAAQVIVTVNDLKRLKGNWIGNLEYLDYSSGKPTRIKAQAKIRFRQVNEFELIFIYPDEPEQNDTSTYLLSKDGTRINDLKIIERNETGKDGLRIVLEDNGTDGNDHRPATFHRVFEFSKKHFFITKLVRWDGEEKFKQRNRYSFSR